MPQLLGGVDVETVTLVASAITVFVGGTVGGVRLGFKKVRGESEQSNRIVGGTIMSSVEIALLSDRLRETCDVMNRLVNCLSENTHQVERLRDKM